ncbi:hypothetical protein J2T18_004526 [Paenibacillus polymyxa]|uniref:hypothetical protein n=1 Tax=Paenibacillus polymyxa TaxID=1406 RepID=UPI002791FEC7|nr:hypothetical protein [Paenibacillus polymyxa]MDQ0050198.1 hypothetical protein [Paenibacillus polymyxa]
MEVGCGSTGKHPTGRACLARPLGEGRAGRADSGVLGCRISTLVRHRSGGRRFAKRISDSLHPQPPDRSGSRRAGLAHRHRLESRYRALSAASATAGARAGGRRAVLAAQACVAGQARLGVAGVCTARR